jgi:hypothetical protein
MAAREQPHLATQQAIAFCKYGETAQQALASITAAINEYAHGDGGSVAVEEISHTVTPLAEPIPPVPGIGDPGPGYFVVTALVTFRLINARA